MNELSSMKSGELSALDNLALQAQMFVQNARMNLLQLGRVFTEAKPLVPHGEWENWIRTNTDLNKRTAEQYMQAYKKFGLNTQIAALGTTKTLKLLPLADEEREKLLAENDVKGMSTRQLDDAIKKQKEQLRQEARKEIEGELEEERALRKLAEQRADKAESAYLKLEEEGKELKQSAAEDNELRETFRNEINSLEQELREKDEIIEEQQADYNRVQQELLNMKSSIAKGDAERIPSDQLTVDTFASAVRVFIGTVARMPHMSATFSVMNEDTRQEYDELLRTVESWTKASRKALDTVAVEGMVIEREW